MGVSQELLIHDFSDDEPFWISPRRAQKSPGLVQASTHRPGNVTDVGSSRWPGAVASVSLHSLIKDIWRVVGDRRNGMGLQPVGEAAEQGGEDTSILL